MRAAFAHSGVGKAKRGKQSLGKAVRVIMMTMKIIKEREKIKGNN